MHLISKRSGLLLLSALVLTAVFLVVVNDFRKGDSYVYQGKAIDVWFEEYTKSWIEQKLESPAFLAFRAMGTNSVPFLTSRICRSISPALGDRFMTVLPRSMRPVNRVQEAFAAHDLLIALPPPIDMVKPLLAPALDKKDSVAYKMARHIIESLAVRQKNDRIYTCSKKSPPGSNTLPLGRKTQKASTVFEQQAAQVSFQQR
jgi:hypothetical protein